MLANMPFEIVTSGQKPQRGITAQINTAVGIAAVNGAIEVFRKCADELRKVDLGEVSPGELARIANHMAKSADEVARLTLFLNGGPDSRPDLGLDQLFARLGPEKIRIIESWLVDGSDNGSAGAP